MANKGSVAEGSVEKRFPLTTVGALVTSPEARVLIVKTHKWRGTWGVPGGKVDWGEDLETALLREFQEEVGLKLREVRFALLQEAVIDPQFYQEAHFILLNYYALSYSENVIPNEEIDEWVWVTPQQALDFPLNSYTRILIEDYLQIQGGTSPVYGYSYPG
ncbi:MAG: NUDIX domain-containing protein [Spirulinaceae cyanobacterium]